MSVINTEQFLNVIKKGTVLCLEEGTCSDLKKLLFEHNTGYVLNKIQIKTYIVYLIDTLTLTKPSINKNEI